VAYRTLDAAAARKLRDDDEALFFVLSPTAFPPPEWVVERLPKVTSESLTMPNDRKVVPGNGPPPENVPAKMGEVFLAFGDMLSEIVTLSRQTQDRVSKFDVKASEDRTKTLQLVASHVSDMRRCLTDWRSMLDEQQTLALDMASKQDEFLQKLDKRIADLSSTLILDHQQLVHSLDLFGRYGRMMGDVRELREDIKPVQSAVVAVGTMAQSLEIGVEAAMELAGKLEGRSDATR
jgi:hypothetical protein